MKKLLKWLIKKFVTRDALKAAIHELNKRVAEKSAPDRARLIMGYGEDAAALTAAYLNAYADDGRVDNAERAAIDAQCDGLVDKYVSDDALDAAVDALIK